MDKAVYKQDYVDITAKILFEKIPYETAITALQKIIASGIFSLTYLTKLLGFFSVRKNRQR